jgi:hypothetical protein
MTIRRHLVLDAGLEDDLFDVIEANLVDPATTGMTFFLDEVNQRAAGLTHYVFLEEEGRVRVVFVVDEDTPVQYLVVESHDNADDVARVAEVLVRNLRVLPPAQLRETAAANIDEAPGHLVRMAVGASPEADAETVEILTRGLTSPNADTRSAAIEAASLTQWPELEEPLRKTAESEQDPDLKQFAAAALDTLRQVTQKH